MHKQLERQLRKARRGEADGAVDLDALLALVDAAYEERDRERRLSLQAAELMEEELRAANRRLKEGAERHLKLILDVMGEGVVLADRDGRILDVNRALLTMFGYSREELLGQPIGLLMASQDIARHDRYVADYHRTGQTRIIGRAREELARHQDGRIFPIDLSVGDLSAAGVPQFVGIIRDITERKRAEARLAESEALFRDFAESSSDWFWESDAEHRFSRFTGFSGTLQDLKNSGLLGKTRLELMLGRVEPDVYAAHAAQLEAHEPFRDLIYPVTLISGRTCYLSVSGKPVFAADGHFLGYRGSATDVSKQVSDRERLRMVEQQLLSAISSISEGFALFDADDKLVVSNERYRELFPRTAHILRPGMTFTELLMHSAGNGGYAPAGEDLEHWLEQRLELHLHPRGEPILQEMADSRWIRTTEYPTPDGGTVGIHTDITESVRLDQDLRRAKEAAEAANRAKSEFLATMSHEIRTPMNGIIGMTGLLLDTSLDREQRHFANTVRVSAESLLTIINDILDISKMEAGRLEFEDGPFDIDGLIEGCVDILSPRLKAKNLALACFVAPDANGIFIGDSGRLRQVLLNLAGNAAKFTERGGVSIDVTLENEDTTRSWLHFAVTDTGIGIADAAKSRMFAMFSQADSSTGRRFGGTGLGLAISKRIVELMGGRIGFDSREGQGSTFWFAVPLVRSKEHRLVNAQQNPLVGLNILIVDDNPINRDVFSRQLKGWGAHAESVDNAAMGLMQVRMAQTQGNPYHLILLDHQLPGMSGIDLAAVLRADPALAGLRLILATSAPAADVSEVAQRLNLQLVLAKPVPQSRLLDAILGVTGRDKVVTSTSHGGAAEAAAAVTGGHAGATAPAPAGQELKILVAEDNAINQQVAVGLLGKLGHRADVADDGSAAVAAVRQFDYDLVLMDMQMPVMDGITATQTIRALPGVKGQVTIIAMTANAMSSDRDACLAAGMNDYIAKPIDRRRLAALFERWTDKLLAARAERGGRSAGLPLTSAGNGPATAASVAGASSGPDGGVSAPPAEAAAAMPPEVEHYPLVDQEALEDLTDALGEEGYRGLVNSFFDGMPAQMQTVEAAMAVQDWPTAAKAAHSLKGASANLGLLRLAKVMARCEAALRGGDAAAIGIFADVRLISTQTLNHHGR